MKKNINGKSIELISEKDHSKHCTCDKYIYFTRKDKNIIITIYKQCTKCWKYLEADSKYDLNKDYY